MKTALLSELTWNTALPDTRIGGAVACAGRYPHGVSAVEDNHVEPMPF